MSTRLQPHTTVALTRTVAAVTARGLTEGQYEQLRKDPVFLFREALVSEAAFLKYTQEAERLEEAQGDFSMSMDALDQFVQVSRTPTAGCAMLRSSR